MPSISKQVGAIKVFFSYAHKDEDLLKELESHLSPLKRQGLIIDWYDREISAGTEWEKEILTQLNTANIILLLISADFIASDYSYGIEVKRAMERHEAKLARVIPIILRAVNWEDTPFGKLQALPTDAKPVTSWLNRDEALLDVAQGIRDTVKEFISTLSLPTDILLPHKKAKSNIEEIVLSVPQSNVSQQKTVNPKNSAEGRRLRACKQELQTIREQLSETNLRNINEMDIDGVKKKLEEINRKVKNTRNINAFFYSIDTVYSNIEKSLWEFEVILFLFAKILVTLDRIEEENIEILEIVEGVKQFYKSLNMCREYIEVALHQFRV